MNEQLELVFRSAIEHAIEESISIGYPPNRIISRLASGISPVDIARRLVLSGDFQEGFREMHARGRSDLTIESIMLQPEFSALFSREELSAARWRLDNHNN